MRRAAVPPCASAARALHRPPRHRRRAGLPVVPGTRVDLAFVKLFTSCLVKRVHSVVEMKVFEIFIPCLHGLGMENKWKNKQMKKTNPKPPAQKPVSLCVGMVAGGGVGEDGSAPCASEHPPVGTLPPAAKMH